MGNRRQRSKPKTTFRRGTTLKGGKGEFRLGHAGLQDRVALMLRRASVQYGNDDVSKQLKKTNTRRDALLAFILTRLITVREVQIKETHEINDREHWFRQAFRGRETIPDPTRWGETARAYQRAAEAIARGQIGRGCALIEDAIEAEHAAFDSIPDTLEDSLDARNSPSEQAVDERPPEMDKIEATETCSAIPVDPFIRQLASTIDGVQARAPLVGWRAKRPHNWWGGEEEEEEENPEGS